MNRPSGNPSSDLVTPAGTEGTTTGSGNLRTGLGATGAIASRTKSLATHTSSTTANASAIDGGKSSTSQNQTAIVRRPAKNSEPSSLARWIVWSALTQSRFRSYAASL